MKGFAILAITALVSAAVALPTPYDKEAEDHVIREARDIGLGFGISGINDYGSFYDPGNYPGYYDPYRPPYDRPPYDRPPYYRYDGHQSGLYAGIGGSIGFGVGANVGVGYGGYGRDYWGRYY